MSDGSHGEGYAVSRLDATGEGDGGVGRDARRGDGSSDGPPGAA